MNNLPSYCGLVDERLRASDKDKSVLTAFPLAFGQIQFSLNTQPFQFGPFQLKCFKLGCTVQVDWTISQKICLRVACRLYASIHTGIAKLGRPTAPTIDTAEVDKIEGRRNFGLLHGLAWGYKEDRDLNLNYVFSPTPVDRDPTRDGLIKEFLKQN